MYSVAVKFALRFTNGAPSRRTLRYNIYHQMKFAGAVCSCQANELRDTGMSRLRGFNRMCSSTLSVNCEKAEKDMLW